MKEAVRKLFGKRNQYYSYTDFSLHASDSEKKRLMEKTLQEANKLQKETAGIK